LYYQGRALKGEVILAENSKLCDAGQGRFYIENANRIFWMQAKNQQEKQSWMSAINSVLITKSGIRT